MSIQNGTPLRSIQARIYLRCTPSSSECHLASGMNQAGVLGRVTIDGSGTIKPNVHSWPKAVVPREGFEYSKLIWTGDQVA